jgi:hypothetical protein
MQNISIKSISTLFVLGIGISFGIFFVGCKASQMVSNKTGTQLWSENCQKCHNTPSPNSFSPNQWETIGLHMQSRALITDDERNKIVAFLKQ